VNTFSIALGIALATALLACLAGLVMPPMWRTRPAGILLGLSGAAGALVGALAVTGTAWRAELPTLLPLAGVSLAADPLSGWFLMIIGVVTAATGVYAIGYAGRTGRGPGSRTAMAVMPLFTTAMLLVPLAASVATFLLVWELMAITSLILVMTEHRHHKAVRPAAVWYAAMTQAGFVTILIGLSWLAAAAETQAFDGIREAAASIRPFAAGTIFLLCLLGFASKAGAVPLHPWLPRAHAEAPSHVSALMSAAMVKLGVYGVLRLGFDLLGGGLRWWWLAVATLGALSAVYGIVQAVVATDLKRLLAFSTSENIGLILLGVGFAGMLTRSGQPAIGAIALAAALLHTANHAGFKTLLFFGAGSVQRATGTRDLDKLGGLSHRMRVTTALVAAGALAAAALPPGNGFISEWLLLQALLHQTPDAGTMLAIGAPIGVAVVALTAGVGVAAFVKMVGTGFLSRPRSDAAARAAESPPSMLTAMTGAAAVCAVLAVVPAVTAPALTQVINSLQISQTPMSEGLLDLRLSGISSHIAPLWIAVGIIAATTAVAVLARVQGKARRRAIAWDCGDGPLTARMEYTATSYAEPLQRVFDNILEPVADVDVTHSVESQYMVASIQYRQQIPDRIENRLYRPLIAAVQKLGTAAKRLAPGVMHRYLAYMLTALVVVLVAGAIR
jgi:formate hydrogenlyase subunit 3/multisubunit Na+/H+ antiporter MnhD subunit